MITMNNFINAINYKITSGSEYGWQCFGHNARWIDSEDEKYTANAVFDSKTQTIFLAEVHDYVNKRSYRWTNPDYEDAHKEEASLRKVDIDQAYDDVKFTNLDVVDDWLEKCTAICNYNFDYDSRVQLELDLSDDEFFRLMTMAHKKDITLNKLIEELLQLAIDQHEANKSA